MAECVGGGTHMGKFSAGSAAGDIKKPGAETILRPVERSKNVDLP